MTSQHFFSVAYKFYSLEDVDDAMRLFHAMDEACGTSHALCMFDIAARIFSL